MRHSRSAATLSAAITWGVTEVKRRVTEVKRRA
jgi:hypothetical protein